MGAVQIWGLEVFVASMGDSFLVLELSLKDALKNTFFQFC